MALQTIYLVNHTHTDFGYTDYPGTLYRLHRSIIDRALDVCETHEGAPEEARFRWTCEVAEITLDWLRHAPPAQIDRFKRLHEKGLIGVAAMPMHWTPLVSPALAERSLDRVRALRQDYGLSLRTAWQCDVNGLAWHWTDTLLDAGIGSLVMASNPHRGMPDALAPRLFDWETPQGRHLPTLHGWHYTYGCVGLRFSEDSTEEAQANLARFIARPSGSSAWPHAAVILQVTNRASPDNGYPTDTLSDFVQRWNAEARVPRLEIKTLDQAMDALLTETGPRPVLSGDWPDYWADGVASTAFETTVARAGERLMPVTDLLAATSGRQDDPAQRVAVQSLSMYDEHTWGAYSSVTMPDAPFARFQHSWKTHQAHDGFASALEAATRLARARARVLTGAPVEGDRHRAFGTDPATPIEAQTYYVLNAAPVPRRIRWPVPSDYGGASPVSILEGWLTEEFMPGMNVQRQRRQPSSSHVIEVDLPAFGEAIVKPVEAASLRQVGADWIQNDNWRVEFDAMGTIRRLVDRGSGNDIPLGADGFGAVVYEVLEDPKRGRGAIFGNGSGTNDWTRPETLIWADPQTRFLREADAEARLGSPRQTPLGPEVDVTHAWSHGDSVVLTWRLPLVGPGIDLTATFAKTRITTPEAFFVSFSLGGEKAKIDLDIGDLTLDADDLLPGACQTWASIQRFATIRTDAAALVVASPDAPLVHPHGAQTEGAGQRLRHDAALGFWVMNNHWDVNFAAGQSGVVPFRFHLLPARKVSPEAAWAFGQTATTPPVIVRTHSGMEREARGLVELNSSCPLELRARPFAPGSVLVSLVNRAATAASFTLRLPDKPIASVTAVSATGEVLSGANAGLVGGTVEGSVPARGVLRLRLGTA